MCGHQLSPARSPSHLCLQGLIIIPQQPQLRLMRGALLLHKLLFQLDHPRLQGHLLLLLLVQLCLQRLLLLLLQHAQLCLHGLDVCQLVLP